MAAVVSGSLVVELLGFFLALAGLIGTLAAMLLPHWRHTAYFVSSLHSVSSYMKGLWMECVTHSFGVYHCEFHRSMLSLPPDLQAARALMVLASAVSVLAAVISAVGMKCTSFLRHSRAKVALAMSGGVCFICSGLFCLITTSWTTNDVLADAHDPFSAGGIQYHLGLCVYIGFASAIFSICGGGILCAASADEMKMKTPDLNHEQLSSAQTDHEDNSLSSLHTSSSSIYTGRDYV